ncbi:MAG: endo alpha-1,4 polygalactosaminidase [Myxococcota bacterium]
MRYLCALTIALAACSSGSGDPAVIDDDGSLESPWGRPPENAGLDYQLGGGYSLPSGVGIVSRDRTDVPAAGAYNICYVNGFQVQPGEQVFWETEHPSLLLRDGGGDLVIDEDWNEAILDTRGTTRQAELASVVGEWIAGCADAGFDAVEIDNLDTYTRSRSLLSEDDAVATLRAFADAAHARGLAIAQKNSSELASRRAEMSADFVVAEECNRYDECDAYTDAYGFGVLIVEYRLQDFERGCAAYPGLSIVLRDRDLVPNGEPGYVFDDC